MGTVTVINRQYLIFYSHYRMSYGGTRKRERREREINPPIFFKLLLFIFVLLWESSTGAFTNLWYVDSPKDSQPIYP